MKLLGRPTLSHQLLLLVAAFVTCDAFKLGESFHEKFSVSTMEGAAHVAQLAYQEKMISTNTWKALSNVTCFLEAAHSAGLTWTESDAENHIVLTANGLKSQLGAKSASAGIGQVTNMGVEFLKDNKDDLVDESLGITTDLVTSWFESGQPPSFEDTVNAAAGLAITAIGMYNPLLGAVAGIAFTLISGILFPGEQESEMEQWYKKIMKEVGIAIDTSHVKAQISDLTLELEAVMDELEWLPGLLGGACPLEEAHKPPADQARTLLTYNIMIQHDLAKLSYKIQNSDYAKPEPLTSANNLWSAGVFPLAEQLILLQSNLLIEIASHESIQNVELAGTRVLRNLRNWQRWIADNVYKAHLANVDQTVETLGWMVGDRRKGNHMDGSDEDYILGKWQKNACNVSGIDACEKMNCNLDQVDWDCGHSDQIRVWQEADKALWSSSWCKGACYKWTAVDFYWQYISPKLDKVLPKVEKMITTFEMKGFEKIGDGACFGGSSKQLTNVTDQKACAEECHAETDCRFFIYRTSNKKCYQYNSDTCALKPNTNAWEAYGRRIAGFEYMNRSHCTSTPYRDWDVTTVQDKEHCARKCRAFHKCKFFAFRAEPERCILFRSETCDLTHADLEFETYRRGTSHAEYFDTPITQANLKHKFRGRCQGLNVGMFPHPLGKLYEDMDRPMAGDGSDEYYALVVQAWRRCFSRDSRTKYVSVRQNGEYFCFKSENPCHQYDQLAIRTWELKNWGPFK